MPGAPRPAAPSTGPAAAPPSPPLTLHRNHALRPRRPIGRPSAALNSPRAAPASTQAAGASHASMPGAKSRGPSLGQHPARRRAVVAHRLVHRDVVAQARLRLELAEVDRLAHHRAVGQRHLRGGRPPSARAARRGRPPAPAAKRWRLGSRARARGVGRGGGDHGGRGGGGRGRGGAGSRGGVPSGAPPPAPAPPAAASVAAARAGTHRSPHHTCSRTVRTPATASPPARAAAAFAGSHRSGRPSTPRARSRCSVPASLARLIPSCVRASLSRVAR